MATTKQRINISVSKSTAKAIKYLAKRDQKPIATKVTDLVEEALELEEDRMLSKIANERDVKGVKWLSHEKTWGLEDESTSVNSLSKSFDFLKDEPDLYSLEDVKK